MTLPISSIVTVNVSVAPSVPAKQGFGTAAFVTKENLLSGSQSSDRILFYSTVAEVDADWGSSSDVSKAATSYFSQSPSPTLFAVIANYDAGFQGTLTGVTAQSAVAQWNGITTGSFAITMNSVTADVLLLDFSGAADMDAVAALIETGIQNADAAWTSATCIWNVDHIEIGNALVGGNITATSQAASGVDISITHMFTDVSISGVKVVAGVPVETVPDSLSAAEFASSNWYGVLIQSLHFDTQVQLDVAAWAEARVKLFSTTSHNPNSLVLGNIDNNIYKLSNSNYQRTTAIFSSVTEEYPDAAVLGKAFTVNFDSPNSVITLKFKPLAGISTENLTTSQKSALDEKRGNALTSIAGTSMLAESFMSSQLFFDERHSIDWLVGEIESNVFGYLITRPTKIPLTDAGASSIEQQLIRALDAANSNGMIGTGTTSGGVFLGNGYITSVQKVADMNPVDKGNRIAPAIAFTALLAGAVHFIQIDGVVER